MYMNILEKLPYICEKWTFSAKSHLHTPIRYHLSFCIYYPQFFRTLSSNQTPLSSDYEQLHQGESPSQKGWKCTNLDFARVYRSLMAERTIVAAYKAVGLSEMRVSPATPINKGKTRTRSETSLKQNLFSGSRITVSQILFLKAFYSRLVGQRFRNWSDKNAAMCISKDLATCDWNLYVNVLYELMRVIVLIYYNEGATLCLITCLWNDAQLLDRRMEFEHWRVLRLMRI